MAALARSRSAVRYDFKGQPDDSTAWPNTFPARGRSTRKSWLILLTQAFATTTDMLNAA